MPDMAIRSRSSNSLNVSFLLQVLVHQFSLSRNVQEMFTTRAPVLSGCKMPASVQQGRWTLAFAKCFLFPLLIQPPDLWRHRHDQGSFRSENAHLCRGKVPVACDHITSCRHPTDDLQCLGRFGDATPARSSVGSGRNGGRLPRDLL